MSRPRVGLVGARRQRQGLGPFVARDLAAAGAEVTCLLGTRPETVAAAREQLARDYGIDAAGYTRIDDMLADARLDALCILSPAETHETYLRAAADAELHVLCEKPLLWGGPGLAARAAALVERFESAGLLLHENCQWPYTLEALRKLHPAAWREPPRQFWMRLSPLSSGVELLGDCLPHPLSVLQALCPAPDARVERPQFEALPPAAPERSDAPADLSVRFDFASGQGRVRVCVELRRSSRLPREAGLGLNGHRAERRVRTPDYAIELADGERAVGVPDPLTALVRDFVSRLAQTRGQVAATPAAAGIVPRMQMLEELVAAFLEWVGRKDTRGGTRIR